MGKKFSTKGPVPPPMGAVGLSWIDVKEYAEHLVVLLDEQGKTAARIVATGLKFIAAVSDRDLTEMIALAASAKADVSVLIEAIRKEFGLE